MATSPFSTGHKGKPRGYAPHEAAHPPSRHSGGTSGNLSIPNYQPRTPTVPYGPSAPPTAIQQGIRRESRIPELSVNHLLGSLSDLLTPGPTAAELADTAHRLGVPADPAFHPQQMKPQLEDFGKLAAKL